MSTVNKKLLLYVLSINVSIFTASIHAENIPSCDVGATENLAIIAATAHLTDNHDGTINDTKTGLIWKKCQEGKAWNTLGFEQCLGFNQDAFTWQEALQHTQNVNVGSIGENFSQTDWRLPNVKELASIVEFRCYDPAINNTVFPDSLSDFFWSSSSYAPDSNLAWPINFFNGFGFANSKNTPNHVRLVRSGQFKIR